MGYFTLARLGTRLGFQAKPKLSHNCEHPTAPIRYSKPALKIGALFTLCPNFVHIEGLAQARLSLSSGCSELNPEPSQCEMPH